MKKTFWLYYGNILVTGVRCEANATEQEVISKALYWHNKCPNVSHLWPEYTPTTIERMILRSEIRD